MELTGTLQEGKGIVKSIKDMKVGEEGYTVPWALVFDIQGKPYLNLGIYVYKNEDGTIQLPITRTGLGKKDYKVDTNSVDYEWNRTDKITETDYVVAL